MQVPKPAPLWFYPIPIALIILNLYTLFGTLSLLSQYGELDVSIAPTIRIGLAVIWIVIFSALTMGLVKRFRFALVGIAPTLTAYGVINIISTSLFARSDYARGQIGFQALATILVLVAVWGIALRRRWISVVKKRSDALDRANTGE